MLDEHVITRLNRNARKQKEYRHIVRGRMVNRSYEDAKREADAFFLRNYAGLTLKKIATLLDISGERVRQIESKHLRSTRFTICHPNKSCM